MSHLSSSAFRITSMLFLRITICKLNYLVTRDKQKLSQSLGRYRAPPNLLRIATA